MTTSTTEKQATRHEEAVKGPVVITFPDGRVIEAGTLAMVVMDATENGKPIQQDIMTTLFGDFSIHRIDAMNESLNKTMAEASADMVINRFEDESTNELGLAEALINLLAAAKGVEPDQVRHDLDEARRQGIRNGSECQCRKCQEIRDEIQKEQK